ncbi:hypothetical protein TNCV_4962251 [Trichonephila clavipes]|nr:hypothetical protein TNCV_4962251 [Trichonephila clavipes]
MDVPLKEKDLHPERDQKDFKETCIGRNLCLKKHIISFENVSPNKSSSAKKLPEAHKISEAYENDVSVEFQENFLRSEQKHGLKYQRYIGDGDSKTFLSIAEKEPYGDSVPIVKIECGGHV